MIISYRYQLKPTNQRDKRTAQLIKDNEDILNQAGNKLSPRLAKDIKAMSQIHNGYKGILELIKNKDKTYDGGKVLT